MELPISSLSSLGHVAIYYRVRRGWDCNRGERENLKWKGKSKDEREGGHIGLEERAC